VCVYIYIENDAWNHKPKIHFNIIFPSKPGSPKWSLSLRVPHLNPVYTSIVTKRVTCPAHLILLTPINRTIILVSSTDHYAPHYVIAWTHSARNMDYTFTVAMEITKRIDNSLQESVNRCLRRILNVIWPNKISKEEENYVREQKKHVLNKRGGKNGVGLVIDYVNHKAQ
jgi:hypothetical protein